MQGQNVAPRGQEVLFNTAGFQRQGSDLQDLIAATLTAQPQRHHLTPQNALRNMPVTAQPNVQRVPSPYEEALRLRGAGRQPRVLSRTPTTQIAREPAQVWDELEGRYVESDTLVPGRHETLEALLQNRENVPEQLRTQLAALDKQLKATDDPVEFVKLMARARNLTGNYEPAAGSAALTNFANVQEYLASKVARDMGFDVAPWEKFTPEDLGSGTDVSEFWSRLNAEMGTYKALLDKEQARQSTGSMPDLIESMRELGVFNTPNFGAQRSLVTEATLKLDPSKLSPELVRLLSGMRRARKDAATAHTGPRVGFEDQPPFVGQGDPTDPNFTTFIQKGEGGTFDTRSLPPDATGQVQGVDVGVPWVSAQYDDGTRSVRQFREPSPEVDFETRVGTRTDMLTTPERAKLSEDDLLREAAIRSFSATPPSQLTTQGDLFPSTVAPTLRSGDNYKDSLLRQINRRISDVGDEGVDRVGGEGLTKEPGDLFREVDPTAAAKGIDEISPRETEILEKLDQIQQVISDYGQALGNLRSERLAAVPGQTYNPARAQNPLTESESALRKANTRKMLRDRQLKQSSKTGELENVHTTEIRRRIGELKNQERALIEEIGPARLAELERQPGDPGLGAEHLSLDDLMEQMQMTEGLIEQADVTPSAQNELLRAFADIINAQRNR
jgi:hypothetical protein